MALNDVSNAGSQFALIPDKTYAKAVLTVEPPKPGKASVGMELLTKDGNGRYLNLKAVITEGKYAKRNLFTTLCTLPNGSEGHAKWEGGSDAMMKAILEQAHGANKQTNPQGYRLAPPGTPHGGLVQAVANAINGREVIIKITQQDGKNGYDDSNSFSVVPKWDDKGALHKEFAGYNPNAGVTGQPVAQVGAAFGQGPVVNAVGTQQAMPYANTVAQPNAGYGYAGNAPVAAPANTNPMASPPPGFIDNADDIPFDA